MAHYYAFCTDHGKCGPNRQTEDEAWDDCEAHIATPKPHGQVYPKLSSFTIVDGRRRFRYTSFKIRSDA